mmetsp:Transcript_3373/g.5657  ORF Transcript_3373/g.5657 Transcript_3373/m.5657 type:complete len:153 (+) Transcript_3373:728-1186(+)
MLAMAKFSYPENPIVVERGPNCPSPVTAAVFIGDPSFDDEKYYYNRQLSHAEFLDHPLTLIGLFSPISPVEAPTEAEKRSLETKIETELDRVSPRVGSRMENQYSSKYSVSIRAMGRINREVLFIECLEFRYPDEVMLALNNHFFSRVLGPQ